MPANRNTLRKTNEQAVMREVISDGPLSRSQISRNLKLNKVTVSEIANDFVNKKKVIEIGTGNSTKNGGRRPTLIALNPKYGYFINVDLGFDRIKYMVNYANGDIQQFLEVANTDTDIAQMMKKVVEQIDKLKISDTLHGLLGIAVSFYGIVYQNKISYSPFIELNNFDIHDYLSEKFKVPVIICNEANANALYQRDFNYDPDCKNLICISFHKGVGAGIIVNDNLYEGTNGEAGEIGNMIIRHDKETIKAEALCSESNVISYLKEQTKQSNLSLTQIADAYSNHDKTVTASLNIFTNVLADIVNNVLVAYAPQKIVFVSDLMEAIPGLLIDTKHKIHHLTQKNGTDLQISNNSKYSTQLGSYSLLLRKEFDLGLGKINLSK